MLSTGRRGSSPRWSIPMWCLLSSTSPAPSNSASVEIDDFSRQSEIAIFPFVFQKNGVETVLGTGKLTKFEKELLEKGLPELKASIEKGVKWMHG